MQTGSDVPSDRDEAAAASVDADFAKAVEAIRAAAKVLAQPGVREAMATIQSVQDAVKAVAIQDAQKGVAIQDAVKAVAIQDAVKAVAIQDAVKAVAIQDAVKAVAIQDAMKAVAIQDAAKGVVIQDAAKAVALQDMAQHAIRESLNSGEFRSVLSEEIRKAVAAAVSASQANSPRGSGS